MQIGELARHGGISVQTVRFYERKRLLPKPQRTKSGYRAYNQNDIKRLKFIKQAKSLGFSLDEIARILQMRERDACPCGEVLSMAESRLKDIDTKLRALEKFRNELKKAVREWKVSGPRVVAADAFCALIERSMG